ncbi:MAG: SH3 domain-containing protein, partial [Spirochaetes bacterium]|nr:SH3 domain-containing protein [Spirochaetota bacterium]
MKKLVFLIIFLSFTIVFAADTKWIGAISGLNMRENPDITSKKIVTIPFTEQITVLETKSEELFLAGEYGHWSKVKWNNYEGWVFSGLLKDFNVKEFKTFALQYLNEMYKQSFS